MNLRKKERLLQSISMKTACGQAGWTTGLFFCVFLAVFLQALLQLEKYRMTALYLEDALAASNLASAVVNVEEYGISHRILIDDPDDAYDRYKWALRENLNLDDEWQGHTGSIVEGPVSIECYQVYNVSENGVTIYHYDSNGIKHERQEPPGSIAAPDGTMIEATSVYSEIAFTVKGFLGTEVAVRRGSLADIVR